MNEEFSQLIGHNGEIVMNKEINRIEVNVNETMTQNINNLQETSENITEGNRYLEEREREFPNV